jgi:hypothetical protein
LFNVTEWEFSAICVHEEILGELVDSIDIKGSSVGNQWSFHADLIACQVSITNELLSWLVDLESFWQLLSSEIHSEGVSTIVSIMDFSYFDGVIS